ncbi:tachylectin-related carbohydrate-binding protein [Micromonospora sp. WMMD1155]|uniref:tachylectin-related carbohydrate-binding protein n=1 Tax=Micromonospora sp. WMMD1155 TaxID=3016094 RepID=UPI00249CB2B1|nr:tachylectin-related carbohydrate-binding protein [Micromonospora sp. WMMD1155]WFE50103.1 tachylectin-related carbohydrate-binding protein [Micromonospora sp. WMMD1155]
MSAHRGRRWGAALLGATVLAGLLGGGSAHAVAGAQPVPDGSYRFNVKISFGAELACSGALVHQDWVVTAKSCFATATTPVVAGPPSRPSTVLVGRTDLTGTTGQQRSVASLKPHPDRDLVLARLSAPVTDVAPVTLAGTAPATADTLTATGYGRTATEWVPDRLHQGAFTVDAVAATTVGLSGASSGATLCRGDAGAPVFRETADVTTLVAVVSSSWQKGCLGEVETRDGATATRVDDLAAWVAEQTADVQIFGVQADGRLTYSVIDSATGDLRANRISTAALGFAPKAMATLNENTILITDTGGTMYRVDVTGYDPLTYTTTNIATGYSPYDRLTYDGYGSLYYIHGTTNELYRRTVTKTKPVGADINRSTLISSGFGQRTITSPGAGRIMGTVADGRLLSYRIYGNGPSAWTVGELAKTGWAAPTHLLSPGGGVYYARTSAGRLDRYRDANPFDGSGTDIASFPTDPVSTSGWNQVLLSARPWTGLVSVFGAKPDGRLSYTAFDPVTGEKRITTVSTQTLGFAPKAMATLNSDTLLVTNNSSLYRVDITGTDPLTFTRTADPIGGGWSHDRLVFDGFGSLFGQANSVLRRYTVTKAKPANTTTDITANTVVIESGFGVPSLAATGKGRLLATTNAGVLAAYTIPAAGGWSREDPAGSGWGGVTSLFSPGGGHYYRRDASGVVTGWLDNSPFNGSGTDLTAYVPAGSTSTGWDALLSAQPYDSWPDSTRRW